MTFMGVCLRANMWRLWSVLTPLMFITFPFCRGENWGIGKLSNVPKPLMGKLLSGPWGQILSFHCGHGSIVRRAGKWGCMFSQESYLAPHWQGFLGAQGRDGCWASTQPRAKGWKAQKLERLASPCLIPASHRVCSPLLSLSSFILSTHAWTYFFHLNSNWDWPWELCSSPRGESLTGVPPSILPEVGQLSPKPTLLSISVSAHPCS